MSKNLFYKQLLEQENELVDALDAIRKLKGHYTKEESPQKTIPFSEAELNKVALNGDNYDKDWLQEEKVLYALKQIKKGTANDVAKVLVSLDENYSFKRAKDAATNKCSHLYREKKIGATRVGKKYRYYILNE